MTPEVSNNDTNTKLMVMVLFNLELRDCFRPCINELKFHLEKVFSFRRQQKDQTVVQYAYANARKVSCILAGHALSICNELYVTYDNVESNVLRRWDKYRIAGHDSLLHSTISDVRYDSLSRC
jgi:hypothetical protein